MLYVVLHCCVRVIILSLLQNFFMLFCCMYYTYFFALFIVYVLSAVLTLSYTALCISLLHVHTSVPSVLFTALYVVLRCCTYCSSLIFIVYVLAAALYFVLHCCTCYN